MDSALPEWAGCSDSGTPTYRSPRLANLGRTSDGIRGGGPTSAHDASGSYYSQADEPDPE